MGAHRHEKRTELFLVRIWLANTPGHAAWRGRVQRVVDGESHDFNDWQRLAELLVEMLPQSATSEPPNNRQSRGKAPDSEKEQ